MLFVATLSSIAQNYQEVVYLKDGSIIRGLIFEQRPNDYLKVRTSSGNVYTLRMNEVDRITKETVGTDSQNLRQQSANTQRSTSTQSSSAYRQNTYANHSYFPSKGY